MSPARMPKTAARSIIALVLSGQRPVVLPSSRADTSPAVYAAGTDECLCPGIIGIDAATEGSHSPLPASVRAKSRAT